MPIRTVPVVSAVYVVVTSRRSDSRIGASPPNQNRAVARRSSTKSSSPSLTNATRAPGSPVAGFVMVDSGNSAMPSCTTAPMA